MSVNYSEALRGYVSAYIMKEQAEAQVSQISDAMAGFASSAAGCISINELNPFDELGIHRDNLENIDIVNAEALMAAEEETVKEFFITEFTGVDAVFFEDVNKKIFLDGDQFIQVEDWNEECPGE